jgi:hypothetical protein
LHEVAYLAAKDKREKCLEFWVLKSDVYFLYFAFLGTVLGISVGQHRRRTFLPSNSIQHY